MSFVKSVDQVAGGGFVGADTVFKPAEVFQILYETKPEAIKKLLPPPLKPQEKPYVIVAHTNFMRVGFDVGLCGPGYLETALYIPALNDGVKGTFVAGMTLNTDIGSFMGRERVGFPKKAGNVGYYYKGNRYVAYSARHGIPYVILEGDMDGEPNDPQFLTEFNNAIVSDPAKPEFSYNFTYKWTPGIGGKLFQSQPLLIQGLKSKTSLGIPKRIGKGKVHLIWSDDDPWAELEVVRVLGASLDVVESRIHAKGGKAIPVDPDVFAPYAFYGWDLMPHEEW